MGKEYVGEVEVGVLCDWLGENICLSLLGSKLEVREKLGKLAVSDQVLAVRGLLLQRCSLAAGLLAVGFGSEFYFY